MDSEELPPRYYKSKLYGVWYAMKRRCNSTADQSYDLYGGRGIKVCAEWSTDFAAFMRDMGEPPPGMTLDRIDPNGDYEPNNCRWATASQQARNRRIARTVEYQGQKASVADLADKFGMKYHCLLGRLNRGWSIDRALREGPQTNGRAVDRAGQRFGRLVVLQRTDRKSSGRNTVWECVCDCGNRTFVPSDKLTCGTTQSCGCGTHRFKAKNLAA